MRELRPLLRLQHNPSPPQSSPNRRHKLLHRNQQHPQRLLLNKCNLPRNQSNPRRSQGLSPLLQPNRDRLNPLPALAETSPLVLRYGDLPGKSASICET